MLKRNVQKQCAVSQSNLGAGDSVLELDGWKSLLRARPSSPGQGLSLACQPIPRARPLLPWGHYLGPSAQQPTKDRGTLSWPCLSQKISM